MITSFEVGSIFRIIDEATPVIERIERQVTALDTIINKARENLTALGVSGKEALAPLVGSLETVGTEFEGVNKQVSSMSRRMTTATERATALAGALDRAAAAGAGVASVPMVGGGGVARGGVYARGARAQGGGGLGGMHVSGMSQRIPGGHVYFRGGNNAAMAGAGALAYGMYEQAKLEDAVFQMKWHAGMANTPENDEYFRNLIQSTASRTGFDYHEIAEAATDEIRLLKGAGGSESGGLGILPEMLRAAAVEAKVKPGTTLKGAMDSLVQQAHMAQEYGIEDIKGMAPLLAFLSTTNPATMPQMVRAASYAMPTLHSALAMDPADVLYQTNAIARAGATNTKSGTWVRAAFERSLPPDPRVVGAKEYERRIFAMREVGLVDSKGKSTVLDRTGKTLDIDKLLSLVDQKTKDLPIEERNAFMKKVFGEQGERGMFLMMSPAVRAQTAELKKEFPEFKSRYETFFEDYSRESPVQKARETWQDLTNVLADIGQFTLPPVLTGLRGLDEIFKSIAGAFPKQGSFGGVPVPGSLGAALGRGMAEGAIAGGTIGGVAGIWTGPGVVATAGTGALFGAGIGGAYEGAKWFMDQMGAGHGPLPQAIAPPGQHSGLFPRAPSNAPINAQITVRAETDDPEGLAHKIAAKLAQMLSHSTEVNQGQGEGVLSSPYTAGGPT